MPESGFRPPHPAPMAALAPSLTPAAQPTISLLSDTNADSLSVDSLTLLPPADPPCLRQFTDPDTHATPDPQDTKDTVDHPEEPESCSSSDSRNQDDRSDSEPAKVSEHHARKKAETEIPAPDAEENLEQETEID